MGGKGVAGIHATGDSYHGGRGRAVRAERAGSGASAAGAPAPPGSCSRPQPRPGRRRRLPPAPFRTRRSRSGPAEPLWPWWDEAIGGYFKFHWSIRRRSR